MESKPNKKTSSNNLVKNIEKPTKINSTINFIPKVKANLVEEKQTILNVNKMAFDLITKFEGFHDKKYWDVVRYSIGYGQPANGKEYITQEEASKFVYDKIENIRTKWGLHKYKDNIEVGLISFAYNLGSPPRGYNRYIENNQIKALKNKMLEYSYAKGKFLRGLYKRRVAESEFIY